MRRRLLDQRSVIRHRARQRVHEKFDRDRIGSTVAGQYENNSRTVLATLQYTDSSYRNAWLEDASHAMLDGTYFGTPAFNPRSSTILGPATGTGPLVFGSNGMLQSGTLTQPHGSWAGSYSPSLQDAINTGSAVPGARQEVWCTKVGATHPGEMYIVAAHMDGIGWGEAANDDGSGTALVMELARVFSSPDVKSVTQ